MSESVSSIARRVLNGQGDTGDVVRLARYAQAVEQGAADAATASRDFGRGYSYAKRLGNEGAYPPARPIGWESSP